MTVNLPPPEKMLFWTPDQQAIAYKNFEALYASRGVSNGTWVRPLPAGPPLNVPYAYESVTGDTDRFTRDARVFGLLVLKDGLTRIERYAGGFGPRDHWTSFSIAKSITSTLIGAAIKDGKIRELDQLITDFVPSLRGSGYEGVTIRQAMNMSTGVRWTENYLDPDSDTNALIRIVAERQSGGLLKHIAQAPRAWPPDSKFEYNTGASTVLGEVVSSATGKHLADYLSEKIWKPAGMEDTAAWTSDGPDGHEWGGGCLNARLRDFGRFGLFAMEGFPAPGGGSVVPDGWLSMVRGGSPASKQYGYQWWLDPDLGFAAIGVFGQIVAIDPGSRLVIVALSAHSMPENSEEYGRDFAYFRAVSDALE